MRNVWYKKGYYVTFSVGNLRFKQNYTQACKLTHREQEGQSGKLNCSEQINLSRGYFLLKYETKTFLI